MNQRLAHNWHTIGTQLAHNYTIILSKGFKGKTSLELTIRTKIKQNSNEFNIFFVDKRVFSSANIDFEFKEFIVIMSEIMRSEYFNQKLRFYILVNVFFKNGYQQMSVLTTQSHA